MRYKFPGFVNGQDGYSLIEILIVLTIILILGSAAAFYLSAHQKLYKTDDQSLLLADILQEARQRSLTQRETMRVEIDITDNAVRLINEKTPATSDDDEVLRELALYFPNDVRMDSRAGNITYNPPEPLPVPSALFVPSVYPSSATHQVCTLRFQSNGTVVDAGNNPIGNGSTVNGATIHLWQPSEANSNESAIARSLTVIGSTGSIRMWEFDPNFPNSNKWKDSRRTGSYGGQGGGS